MERNTPHVVAFGNPFDGVTLYGPFPTWDDAADFGEAESDQSDWFVVSLESPKSMREVQNHDEALRDNIRAEQVAEYGAIDEEAVDRIASQAE